MTKTNWKELLQDYPANEGMVQLYEDWGKTVYLKEVFNELTAYNPEWNKEKELGSWAAEFILGMLEDLQGRLDRMSVEERVESYNVMLDDRYEDFRNGHQFSRVNNVAIKAASGEQPCDDIGGYVAAEGEKIGFPVLL